MATIKARTAAGWIVVWTIAAGAVITLGGCDLPPPGPTTGDGRAVEVLLVSADHPAEKAAVSKVLQARADYEHALMVLRGYYDQTGALDQRHWLDQESANLAAARKFRFEGADPAVTPASESLVGATEPPLVERVIRTRDEWKQSLLALEDYYQSKGLNFKLAVTRTVRRRFDPVHQYSYFLNAEVPPATLTAKDPIAPANELFAKALKLHRRGKLIPLMPDYKKQREALKLLLKLVNDHPTSDKIAPSAFYIAEIYKEYFNENIRAVTWYERAWQWDPNLMLPARFQAAVIYDIRLAHYAKALALYREVLRHESFNSSNVDYSISRIRDLTESKKTLE